MDRDEILKKLMSGELNRDEILKMLETIQLSEKEEIELLQLVEAERRDEALQDNEIFAEEYIKIVDKKGNQIPFKHNSIQVKINLKKKALRAQGKLVRIIVIKPRQCGVSTHAQGDMICNATTKENRTGLIVAHTQPATTIIFDKAKYMYDNLPAQIKPLQKASNAKELIFDRPAGYKGKGKGLNSKINIQVAGDVNIGRGDTIHYFHGSEVAFWPCPDGKGIKKQLAGIMAAMPKTLDTEAELESTANGYNEFKELCDDAKDGKNEWTLMFFAWHEFELNVMECTGEEYQRLVDNLDKKIYEYLFGTPKQQGIAQLFNLTKEQVKWWIWTYRNDNNSDFNMMKQENPSTYDEAFISTGTPVFDNEKVNARISYLRKKYKKTPPKVGRFSFEWNNPDSKDYIKDNTIKFVEDLNGFVTIYEDKQDGFPYVIGGDTKGEGRDFYTGVILNNTSGRRAATIRNCWTNSKPYTWQMYCAGIYFNLALIGIEVNFNTAPIEELERLHYPRQYTRRMYDNFTKDYTNKHGWKTDGNTRPLIIDKEVNLIEDNIDLFNDIPMLEECLTFIYKDGRPDAMSGKHDDLIIADAIANEIRGQQSFEAERDPEIIHRSFDEDNLHDRYREDESPWN
ncbi:MAG: hypothetical protein ABFD25_00945 [Clostridiaceae bacterium]